EPKDRHDPQTWEAVGADRVEWVSPPSAAGETGKERRAVVALAGRRHVVRFVAPAGPPAEVRPAAGWVGAARLLKTARRGEECSRGGERKQYRVLVDPAALLEYGVTLQQVEQALKDNNVNASGGFAVQGETERPIRVLGRLGPEPSRVLDELRK